MISDAPKPAEAEPDDEGSRPPHKRLRLSDGLASERVAFQSDQTQRADPTLQLDVDVLTLEYLLHQAIGAQFEALKSENEGSPKTTNANARKVGIAEEKARRLLEMFEASVAQFQLLHPDHQLEPGTDFNLTLLESIVLLRSAKSASIDAENSGSSSAIERNLNSLLDVRDSLRRRMLTTSSDQAGHDVLYPLFDDSAEDTVKLLRDFLFFGWTEEGRKDTDDLLISTFPIYRVLVRFMVLSARIAQSLETTRINQQWMHLACELMLHAALEALEASDFLRMDGDISPKGGAATVHPGLLECFAFRHLPDETRNRDFFQYRRSPFDDALTSENRVHMRLDNSLKEEEQDISDMFARDSVEWDRQRQSYLQEFKIPAQVLAEAAGEGSPSRLAAYYKQRLADLRFIHPFAKTKASLVLCLESLWQLNTSPAITGKPVLVQIEEGGLDGFTEEEFESFLSRVQLDRGCTFEKLAR